MNKFEEYISDIDNPKRKQIATSGREYAMKTFNNDKGVIILN